MPALFSFINLSVCLFAGIASANQYDTMVKNADKFRLPAGSLNYEVTIKDYEGSKELRTTKYDISFAPTDKLRAETKFPARSIGRNLLMIGNDMWLQTPDIQRPTRISFQQKLTGEVANGDLARTNYAADYSASRVEEKKTK